MSALKEKLDFHFRQIELIVDEIPKAEELSQLSKLEVNGTAKFIHDFYNGVENVFKIFIKHERVELPTGANWHKDLLNLAVKKNIISSKTGEILHAYVAFRHHFSNNYGSNISAEKLKPLVAELAKTAQVFLSEVRKESQRLP